MKIEREKAERIKVLIDCYNKRIDEYEKDISKFAELRAVRTLRDGVLQVLEILAVDGLKVCHGVVKQVHFDVSKASVAEGGATC